MRNDERLEKYLGAAYTRMEETARALGLRVPKMDMAIYLVGPLQLITPLALGGVPERYAHWSFGKKAEMYAEALRDKGVNFTAEEVLIPSSPPRAFLLKDASLPRKLTMLARIIASLDFASRNDIWQARDFDRIWQGVREHARFIETLTADPAVGEEKVVKAITAAHAIAPQCRHTRMLADRTDDFLEKIAKDTPGIEDWTREVFRMVHEEWRWFLPLIETQMMMKGWASWWQLSLLRGAGLSRSMLLQCIYEFARELAMPPLGELNLSLVGYRMFENIAQNNPELGGFLSTVAPMVWSENDATFAQHLTQETALKCGLFSWGPDPQDTNTLIVQELSDPEGWKTIRDRLAKTLAGNRFPAFRITVNTLDSLKFEQDFDGRGLDTLETQGVLRSLWEVLQRKIIFESALFDAKGDVTKTQNFIDVKGETGSWSVPKTPDSV